MNLLYLTAANCHLLKLLVLFKYVSVFLVTAQQVVQTDATGEYSDLNLQGNKADNSSYEIPSKEIPNLCKYRKTGYYCHPMNPSMKIYCDQKDPENPSVTYIECAKDYICRTHKKLSQYHILSNTEKPIEKATPASKLLLQFNKNSEKSLFRNTDALQAPQCIHKDSVDLDAFCEDKLEEDWLNAGGTWAPADLQTNVRMSKYIQRENRFEKPIKSGNIMAVSKQCSPFNPRRKFVLSCTLLRRKQCNMPSGCETLVELYPVLDKCHNFDVCRKYDDILSNDVRAQCVSYVQAMCQDRLFAVYRNDVMAKVKAAADKEVSDLSVPLNISINFKFCDPFQAHLQLECALKLEAYGSIHKKASQLISDEDFTEFKSQLELKKPNLYNQLFHMFNSGNDAKEITQYKLLLKKVNLIHHKCPDSVVRLKNIYKATDESIITQGPVCRQLSKKVSKCMPKARMSLPQRVINKLRHRYETQINPGSRATHLEVDTYAGFCLNYKEPGQYCIPGTPESGVICPQGIPVMCARPIDADKRSWTDIGKAERCTQYFGEFPPVKPDTLDAFRRSPVLDLYGRAVSYGYYARCEPGE